MDAKEGQAITGRVTLPDGVPLQSVGIGAGSSQGFNAQARADPKTGTFSIEGLPPGTYSLHAHAWHEGTSYQGTGKAVAGGDVTLELKKREGR